MTSNGDVKMTSISKTTYVESGWKAELNHAALNSNVKRPPVLRKALIGTLVAAVMATGCEAPLNLEGVDRELAKQIRRTDQFQAIASNGNALVAVGADGLVMVSDANNVELAASADRR